jgi:opacity protein-like surface antigen
MTTTRTRITLATGALALLALPSSAGELALEAHGGYFQLAAENSASALFDSRGGPTFGGALRYTLWRGAFVSAGARTFSKEGERVFVTGVSGEVQKLGFPLSVRITPVFLTVGYRFRDGRLIVPYVGAGASRTSYQEESEVAGETFDDDRSKTGFLGVAGVEVGRGTFRVGAEVGYSAVSDALGLGGVSKVYGEDNLGGVHAVGKLIVAFGGK